ncbi:MAG: hypothetical protein ACKV2O_08485 [Acidimicrobiales bacterium]
MHDTFGRLTEDNTVRYTYDGADRAVTRDLSAGVNTDRFTFLGATQDLTGDSNTRYALTAGGQPIVSAYSSGGWALDTEGDHVAE